MKCIEESKVIGDLGRQFANLNNFVIYAELN